VKARLADEAHEAVANGGGARSTVGGTRAPCSAAAVVLASAEEDASSKARPDASAVCSVIGVAMRPVDVSFAHTGVVVDLGRLAVSPGDGLVSNTVTK